MDNNEIWLNPNMVTEEEAREFKAIVKRLLKQIDEIINLLNNEGG